jgi:hypothetical protein
VRFTDKVALTAGYALETTQAAAACINVLCQVTSSSVLGSSQIENRMVQVVTETALERNLAIQLVNTLSSGARAAKASKSCNDLVNLSRAAEKDVLDNTIAASHKLVIGIQRLASKLSGEKP